jgi:hypothetical protein
MLHHQGRLASKGLRWLIQSHCAGFFLSSRKRHFRKPALTYSDDLATSAKGQTLLQKLKVLDPRISTLQRSTLGFFF